MSRIGKLPIELNKGVEVNIQQNNEVIVKCDGKVLKVLVKPVINVQV